MFPTDGQCDCWPSGAPGRPGALHPPSFPHPYPLSFCLLIRRLTPPAPLRLPPSAFPLIHVRLRPACLFSCGLLYASCNGSAGGDGSADFLDSADYRADVHQGDSLFSLQLVERNSEDMKRIYLALTAAGLMVYLAGCCVDRHRTCGASQGPEATEGCGVQCGPAQPEPTCGVDVEKTCPCREPPRWSRIRGRRPAPSRIHTIRRTGRGTTSTAIRQTSVPDRVRGTVPIFVRRKLDCPLRSPAGQEKQTRLPRGTCNVR